VLLASSSQYKYEVTPMIGGAYTEGNLNLDRNYAVGGLSLGFNLDESIFDQVELGILRSLEDVDYENSTQDTAITRIFSNVVKEYPMSDNSSFYALIGAGVELFSNEAFKNENGLFGNYGVGYKYTFNNDMALKFDLRHLIETDHGDNNLLYTLGLAIPFGKKAAPVAAAPLQESVEAQEEQSVASSQEEQSSQSQAVADVDSDNDGVMDSVDQCPNSEPEAVVDATGCAINVNLKVLFGFDKANIKDSYDSKISGFADILKKYPMIKTKLSAHTDSIGDENYNLKLSQERADAVKQALINLGIEDSRITTKGYGETKPVANNATPEGRAQNRRVEATVFKK
jgi:OOP family OmpA-OmpF porin